MNWVTIIWSMTASACLTLALMNFFIWCRQRDAWANLLFALMAVGTAALAGFELAMMRATTTATFGLALRWLHVPAWVIVVSLVGFVRLYLNAGRGWLLWSICGLHSFSLVLNFVLGQSLNYWQISELQPIPFLGESVSVAEGVLNHWMLVGQASFLLLLIFVVDATLTAWRHGDRRRALVVGGSVVFFVLAATGEATLILWHVLRLPIIASLPALVMVAAMSFELSRDAQRAAQLARELHESEERMVLATDAADLGIWTRELTRNEIWASDKWRELFGFTKSERLDFDRFLQRLHPDDREAMQAAMAKACAGAGNYKKEYRVLLPDGRTRWISARGRVEFNGGGRPVLARGTVSDITERKQSELEITQHRNEMTHLARVATVNELSGSLAHELNQPLAIIMSNAQAAQRLMAQEPPDLAEIQDILADIVSEDQRAGEVIKRLRSLLKPGEIGRRPVNLNTIVEETLNLLRSDLRGNAVTVQLQLATNGVQVSGDPIQLQQVLLNLILNACDAMDANPPARRQLTLASTQKDGVARVSVSDTGCGLPPDMERVFKPFYTTKQKGLGLGLTICRSIAAAHAGRLWAEAHVVPGIPADGIAASCGATFHLELPLAAAGTKTP